jgi:hypothetical protein
MWMLAVCIPAAWYIAPMKKPITTTEFASTRAFPEHQHQISFHPGKGSQLFKAKRH